MKPHFYLTKSNLTTVPLERGSAMDVDVSTLPDYRIDFRGNLTLLAIEGEVPTLTARRAPLDTQNTLVHNSEKRLGVLLIKGTLLVVRQTCGQYHVILFTHVTGRKRVSFQVLSGVTFL